MAARSERPAGMLRHYFRHFIPFTSHKYRLSVLDVIRLNWMNFLSTLNLQYSVIASPCKLLDNFVSTTFYHSHEDAVIINYFFVCIVLNVQGSKCIPANECPCAFRGSYYDANSVVSASCKKW